MSKFFEDYEFECPCCKQANISPLFVNCLDAARLRAGVPFKITSGYRCPNHNRAVGGSPTSSHMLGIAVDIAAGASGIKFLIVKALIESGFTRIGIGKDFVHVDMDGMKPSNVMWTY